MVHGIILICMNWIIRVVKNLTRQIGDHLYIIKNRFRDGADPFYYKLADKIYKSIRLSDTNISDIHLKPRF
jgi:hypothetical protein